MMRRRAAAWRALLLVFILQLLSFMLADASDFFHSFGGGAGGGGGGGNPFFRSSQFGGGGGAEEGENGYYKTLGLERDASLGDIKKAYRRLAMTKHPDKGGDAEEFKALNEAYETLSDPDKRAHYDRFGLQQNSFGGQGHQQHSAADLARELFRNFGGGGFLRFQLDLSLEDFFKGKELVVPISNVRVNVSIKPGMFNGQELMLRGHVYDERGMQRDIVFRLREVRHAVFQRKNADLLIDLSISLRDALLGLDCSITHLDGSVLKLQSKKGDVLSTNDVLIVPNQGMPLYNEPKQRGRLFIRIKVDTPKRFWLDDPAQILELERLLLSAESIGGTKSRSSFVSASIESEASTASAASTPHAQSKADEASSHVGGKKKPLKKSGKHEKTSSSKASEAAPPVAATKPLIMSRGDLGSFGLSGQPQEEEEEDYASPFASYFFR